MPSVGFPLSTPILMHEGNQATIASVLADRSMPSLKRLDALARALHHEWKLGGRFIPAHAQPKCQLAHVNAKPHEGPTLERLAHQIIGVHFYPAQGTGRCKLGTFDLFCEKEARAPVEQWRLFSFHTTMLQLPCECCLFSFFKPFLKTGGGGHR